MGITFASAPAHEIRDMALLKIISLLALIAPAAAFAPPASAVVASSVMRTTGAVTMFSGSSKSAPKKVAKKPVKKAAPKKVVKKPVKKAAPKKVVKKPVKKVPKGEPSFLQQLFSLSMVGGAQGL